MTAFSISRESCFFDVIMGDLESHHFCIHLILSYQTVFRSDQWHLLNTIQYFCDFFSFFTIFFVIFHVFFSFFMYFFSFFVHFFHFSCNFSIFREFFHFSCKFIHVLHTNNIILWLMAYDTCELPFLRESYTASNCCPFRLMAVIAPNPLSDSLSFISWPISRNPFKISFENPASYWSFIGASWWWSLGAFTASLNDSLKYRYRANTYEPIAKKMSNVYY